MESSRQEDTIDRIVYANTKPQQHFLCALGSTGCCRDNMMRCRIGWSCKSRRHECATQGARRRPQPHAEQSQRTQQPAGSGHRYPHFHLKRARVRSSDHPAPTTAAFPCCSNSAKYGVLAETVWWRGKRRAKERAIQVSAPRRISGGRGIPPRSHAIGRHPVVRGHIPARSTLLPIRAAASGVGSEIIVSILRLCTSAVDGATASPGARKWHLAVSGTGYDDASSGMVADPIFL